MDPKFGTGAVKVTPAHDPNDFQVAKRHGLPEIVVMDEDGRINDAAGDFRCLDGGRGERRHLHEPLPAQVGLHDRVAARAVAHAVPVRLDLSHARADDWDPAAVEALFRELEFRTLVERLGKLKKYDSAPLRLPRLSSAEQTKASWAKNLKSYSDLPPVYQPFFSNQQAQGVAFPYTQVDARTAGAWPAGANQGLSGWNVHVPRHGDDFAAEERVVFRHRR